MNNTYDSKYSITLEINLKLGNEPKNFDSTYSILLGILPLVEPEPADAKYVKVSNDWIPANGDKIVFVWSSTEYSDGNGGIATFPVNPTNNSGNTALLLSDYKIQIIGDEFPESELNNVTKAYYYSSTDGAVEYDVSAAVFTIEYDSDNTGFFFLKNEDNYLRTGTYVSNRKLLCDSDGTTNALWDSQTSNNKIVLHNNRSSGTNVYLMQAVGGTDTRNKWISNYGLSSSKIPDIYKLVKADV